MPKAQANGIEIEYESFGDPSNETVLMIMGLGGQLIRWPVQLHQDLVDLGYHVVRYDNRDVGLSTKFDSAGTPRVKWLLALSILGISPRVPYTLLDMADDAVGLLDFLQVEKAHVFGVSLGGMIAQLVAGHYPERVLSLTSFMSTTGNRQLPRGTPEALRALFAPAANPNDPEAIISRSARIHKILEGPAYPRDLSIYLEKARLNYQRSYYPQGAARHLAASIVAKDRRKLLKTVKVPAMVLHGEEDPLVPVECGIDTAENLPNSELRVIPGLGHDIPDQVLPQIVAGINDVAGRARAAGN